MFADFYKTDKNKLDKKYSQYNQICNCPHCGAFPNEEKTKKFKCNNCNKFVFVKKINYKYYFLTESENKEVGEMRKFDALKEKYFNLLVNNGYAQNQLDNDFERNKITSIEQLKDFIWSSFNNMVTANSNDFTAQSLIYFAMATYCANERDGNNVYDFQKLAFDYQLEGFLKGLSTDNSLTYEVTIISAPTNPECYKDHSRILSVNDAVTKQILPHNVEGNKHGCCCTYGFRAKRDGDGNLIWND